MPINVISREFITDEVNLGEAEYLEKAAIRIKEARQALTEIEQKIVQAEAKAEAWSGEAKDVFEELAHAQKQYVKDFGNFLEVWEKQIHEIKEMDDSVSSARVLADAARL